MRFKQITFLIVLFVLSACNNDTPPPTLDESPISIPSTAPCPNFVQDALSATDNVCESVGRNQACYGHTSVTANPQNAEAELQFQQAGDLVNIARVSSLKLDPLQLDSQIWGIAILRLQANLSDTNPGQNVTFLMFGDVELENRSPVDTTHINSFYFTSGIGDSACAEAPESGLIIQTPEGVGKVDLLINEVDISIGSTAFLQAVPNANMVINVVEGEADISSQGETQSVLAGNRTTVRLDGNGIANSPPTSPEPYDVEPIRQLPVRQLPHPITITKTGEASAFPAIGFEVSDSINDPSEVDIYEFEGNAGQFIYIESLTEPAGAFWSLHLNRPENADRIQNSQSRITALPYISSDIGLVELPETGTYQILVYTEQGYVGDYHFKVWDVPPPDRPELIRPDDGHERLLGIGSGGIETLGSWDEYTLTVNAGQTLYFDGLESDWNVKWNIFGQDGEKLVVRDFDVSIDLGAITFESAGTYTLRVWGHMDAVGTYRFEIREGDS